MPDEWRWLGHRVITADGTTVTMVDTQENQAATLLACCKRHVVGDWPDRYEPQVVKRRQKPYKLMQKLRRDYKPGDE